MLRKKAAISGFSLIEFMISITISLFAIGIITSIFVSGLIIDAKNIKMSRLSDEVNSLMQLLIQDIRRAGYVSDAEILLTNDLVSGNTSRCRPIAIACTDLRYRTIVTDQFDANEPANSCITFFYDRNNSGNAALGVDANNDDFMGYRLHDGAIEVRVGRRTCRAGRWQNLSDEKFVQISDLHFNVQQPARDDSCTVAGTKLNCIPLETNNEVFQIAIGFTATLLENGCTPNQRPVDPDCVVMTVNKTVVVRNASYN